MVDDVLGHVAGFLAECLGQAHGAIGLVVAVSGILSRLDHGGVRLRIGRQGFEGFAKAVLQDIDNVHAVFFTDRSPVSSPSFYGRTAPRQGGSPAVHTMEGMSTSGVLTGPSDLRDLPGVLEHAEGFAAVLEALQRGRAAT